MVAIAWVGVVFFEAGLVNARERNCAASMREVPVPFLYVAQCVHTHKAHQEGEHNAAVQLPSNCLGLYRSEARGTFRVRADYHLR